MKSNYTITVNPTGHKVYFSSALIRRYSLQGKYFAITFSSCGASLRISSKPFEGSFQINKYNGAFYLKSKRLHLAFTETFKQLENKMFQVIVRPGAQQDLLCMSINKSFTMLAADGESMRNLTSEDRAKALYEEMVRTDFPGRIKTLSMMELEKRFSSPLKSRVLA